MIITQSDRNFYNKHKDEYTHILSLVCPDEKELLKPIHEHHYIVKMWDIDKPLKNKFREYEPPTKDIVLNPVYDLSFEWREHLLLNKDFRLLIHCDAGISRSPAITLGLLWDMSYYIFNKEPLDAVYRTYIEARKQWCKSLLDWDNSTSLCRYIDGRFNPGVKPNQAILQILREQLTYFPW